MQTRWWTMAGVITLLSLTSHAAQAQITGLNAAPMKVLLKFSDKVDPFEMAPRMASASGMELLGVSRSTHTAVFVVTNERSTTGVVAASNQRLLMSQFPNTVQSYNYGQNMATPVDLEQPGPQDYQDGHRQDVRRDDAQDGRRRDPYNRPSRRFFTDQDRQSAVDWYTRRQASAARLRVGTIMDQDLLLRADPAPTGLVRRLPPVPAGSRYLLIGGSVALVDGRDYVQDVLRFDTP
jgi:hypothetical protein